MVVAYGREAEHWDEMERPFIQQAHLFRGIAARRASTKRLAELDKQRCKLPGDPAYGADFGGGRLVELLGPQPQSR